MCDLGCIVSPRNYWFFIILHPSHQSNYFDFSVSPIGYLTPLGTMSLDVELYNRIAPKQIKISLWSYTKKKFYEIQLPLVNYFFPQAKILPIMIGNQIPAVANAW
jgi:AmmeMemoRadiSam system protein B